MSRLLILSHGPSRSRWPLFVRDSMGWEALHWHSFVFWAPFSSQDFKSIGRCNWMSTVHKGCEAWWSWGITWMILSCWVLQELIIVLGMWRECLRHFMTSGGASSREQAGGTFNVPSVFGEWRLIWSRWSCGCQRTSWKELKCVNNGCACVEVGEVAGRGRVFDWLFTDVCSKFLIMNVEVERNAKTKILC